MRIWLVILLLVVGCKSSSTRTAPAPSTQPIAQKADDRQEQIQRAIDRGVEFLVKSQQQDGSWGTGLVTRGFEVYSMVPGSLDAFRVGATSLCVMALREVGEKEAHDRGVQYLIHHGEARRDDEHFGYVAAWEYAGPDRPPGLHKEPLVYEEVHMSTRSYK